MRIFLAGATGAIGRRLVPLLVADGHAVTGTTRSRDKVALVEALGAKPAIVDAFDRAAVIDAVGDARPDVVIHQLTDLPQAFDATGIVHHHLEDAVASTPGLDGLVLRYGRLYGPGTWRETEPGQPPAVHGDAAAAAALLAVTRGAPGIYNIADEDGAVSIAKARRELGFDPAFRVRE